MRHSEDVDKVGVYGALTDLPAMLDEHQAIVGALRHLDAAAKREGKEQYAEFAQKLMLHAQTEEEVSYPTAILIGEYLKLNLSK